jgi:hypothetical protein
MIAASTPGDPGEKRIVTVSPELAKSTQGPVRRKLQKKAPEAQINESIS